jgi:RNA polymerase sigma-70 factor (ECF subfamily)
VTQEAADFGHYRDHLVRVAYRLLGTIDDAEDVVQDVLARVSADPPGDLREPAAWLTRVVTNAAIDRLRSARVRREQYVGPWLPEPSVVAPWAAPAPPDPSDRVTLDDEISLALLTVLETLSPAERAVYVLHEAFGIPLSEVAAIVGRSEQACRQLAVRARRHVQERAPRFDPDREERARVVAAFHQACENGDLDGLARLLDDDVVLRADGGGVVTAAHRPIVGRTRVMRTLEAAVRSITEFRLHAVQVNGEPGLLLEYEDGPAVINFVVRDGRVSHIDIVANPEKLRHLPPEATWR